MTRALARLSRTVALPKVVPARNDFTRITDAILTMRAADPAFDLNPELRALRRALADRIEADIATLDMLGGDPDNEACFTTVELGPDGACVLLGRSSDDEPSLCGVGHHEPFGNRPGLPRFGGDWGDSPHDLEGDDADFEPSLGAPEPLDWQAQTDWAQGGSDDRENAECIDCDGEPTVHVPFALGRAA